jgi:hypothetical protein
MNATRSPARLAARFAVPGEPPRPLQLEFFQLSEGAGPLDESQGFLFDTIPHGSSPCCSFSGGLDSTAGLAAHLVDGDAVAISVDTNNWMQHVQQRVLHNLQGLSVHTCVPLRYRVSVGASSVENRQRSRGLLFLAVGIATSWALRQDRLLVFENGIGAINLPYLRSQFGSQATRSMHPRTLRLAERDHAPCGTCTSCLLRRQALHAAGRADLDAAASYRTSSPVHSVAFQAMAWQVTRLRACLAQADPWISLISEFPEILDTAPLAPTDVVSLYRSYVREWESLEATSETGGRLERQGRAAS